MKKANKVMLITPPYHCGVVESAGRWPNLAFIYIAGELEKHGFEVKSREYYQQLWFPSEVILALK